MARAAPATEPVEMRPSKTAVWVTSPPRLITLAPAPVAILTVESPAPVPRFNVCAPEDEPKVMASVEAAPPNSQYPITRNSQSAKCQGSICLLHSHHSECGKNQNCQHNDGKKLYSF